MSEQEFWNSTPDIFIGEFALIKGITLQESKLQIIKELIQHVEKIQL